MDAPETTKIILEDLLSKALKLCPDLIYFFIPPEKQEVQYFPLYSLIYIFLN